MRSMKSEHFTPQYNSNIPEAQSPFKEMGNYSRCDGIPASKQRQPQSIFTLLHQPKNERKKYTVQQNICK